MDDLEAKFRIRVEGQDELEQFFAGGARGAKTMQSVITGALGDTAKSISSFTLGLARDLKSVSGLKLGIADNARGALEFRDSLEQLAVSAGIGDDKIAGLKQQILDTASASNQFKSDVTGALQAFVEKTGDIDTARKNLALYAQTATATRAAITDVAEVGVQLSDKLNVKDQANSFAILATQAKAGAIELKDMAQYAPRIFSSGAAAGLTGEKGVREAGALAQVYAKAFGGRGSGANVATAIENTFRDIAKKAPALEAAGIKVAGRDPMDVLFDIIRKTGGDSLKLARTKIFDARSMRGVNILANEFRSTGGFGTYESFRDVNPAAGILASDAARQSSTGLAALKRSQIAIERSSDANLGDAADVLAQHSGLISDAYGALTSHPIGSAIGGAATLFGVNAAKRAVLGRLGGGLGGALGSAGGATPVMVTNWPASFGGPSNVPGDVAKGAVPLLGAIGSVAIPAGLALAALAVHDAMIDPVAKGIAAGQSNLVSDLASGRKHRVKSWRDWIGGAKYEDGPAPGAATASGAPVNHIKVEIHGDKATVTESGTRSTTAMVKRMGGG